MKVYVDEMPKVCADCKFCYYENSDAYCLANFIEPTKANPIGWHKTNLERDFSCPLKSIQDHDKEIRKQVCDEIREELSKELDYNIDSEVPILVVCHKINRVLDQIEKGSDSNDK